MAGPFTHFMLCYEIQSDLSQSVTNRQYDLPNELRDMLVEFEAEMYLGSQSPDIPYIFDAATADSFHTARTNGIVLAVHKILKSRWANRNERDRAAFVWLLGYLSHLVADETIHPIVEAIVGRYDPNDPTIVSEHGFCERTQDTMVFDEVRGGVITKAEFSEHLEESFKRPHFDYIMELWADGYQAAYGGNRPDTKLWTEAYNIAIDTTEGDDVFRKILRHIPDLGEKVYFSKKELEEHHPEAIRKYYSRVALPHNQQGSFMKDGFYFAARNISNAWVAAYNRLFDNADLSMDIRDINLDTGISNADPQSDPFYWPKA